VCPAPLGIRTWNERGRPSEDAQDRAMCSTVVESPCGDGFGQRQASARWHLDAVPTVELRVEVPADCSAAQECLVCASPVHRFFSKDFAGDCGLGEVSYTRCGECGFVSSRTHQEMTEEQWKTLNARYHGGYLGKKSNSDDPRWLERISAQADVIGRLAQASLLPQVRPWVDWGCGDGKLADLLSDAGLATGKYDEFMGARAAGWATTDELQPASFDFVISTSVFEHFRRSSDFSRVLELVGSSGVVGLHTMVREAVPRDPNWFYLLPVHCAFFTNTSMQILFEKWGFSSSLYAIDARMWFWFRSEAEGTAIALRRAGLLHDEGYRFKHGFVDYWTE